MKKVGLYVRVSTQEQKLHGISIENQLDALQKYCKEKGYIIVATYNDAGVSAHGSYKKRPALLQMIQDCQEKKIELLLFTRLDRFFRSVGDYYLVTSQMDKVPWKAIWEEYETETSDGQFRVNIMLSIAEAEAARTSEKIKSIMDYKRERGDHLGTVPLGYRTENKKLAIDPTTEPIVREIFSMYDSGKGPNAIRKYLSSVGHDMHSRSIRGLIFSPVYAGDDNGRPCPAYFSKEEYQRRLATRKIHEPRNDRRETYIFSGLIKCGVCGATMHAQKANGKYLNYICTTGKQKFLHPGLCASEKHLESTLLSRLQDFADEYNFASASAAPDEAEREKEIATLKGKLKRIGVRYEDGDISTEEYRAKRDDLKSKIAALEVIPSAKQIILPDGFSETYVQLGRDGKQRFWRSLITSITFYPDRKYNIQVGDIFWR